MSKYYIDISDELAGKLDQVAEDDIIEVLSKLAEKEADDDELSAYSSVAEIEADTSLSPAERKRLKLKAQRRHDISAR